MKELKGKNCFITGAASSKGIGRSLAIELAKEGMNMFITDVDMEGLENVKKEIEKIGVKVFASKCDVSRFEDWERCEEEFRSKLGDIDLLVNNAGIAIGGSILELEIEDWEKVLGINLWSIIFSLKTFVPRMMAKGSGHIVNVSSGAGIFGSAEPLPYVTSKFAIVGLSEALFGSLNDLGIKVSIIFPSIIATNIWKSSELKIPQKLIDDFGAEKIEETLQTFREAFLSVGTSAEVVAKIYVKEIKENKLYICDNKEYFNILALKSQPEQFENMLKTVHTERAEAMRNLYHSAGINIEDYR
ncbi:MAG: SDR family NAD(P)-dependent oxidoreductase [Candidatus Hodarchaeales archaeon]|jgi:short-subunit dehydrogenase